MTATPPIVTTLNALRAEMAELSGNGLRTALVPTMGALHEGHLSLVRLARETADRTIVSIFVNPAQFAPGEDYEAYPRDITRDTALLAEAGVDLIYVPPTDAMYEPDHSTRIVVGGVGDGLETDHRPTFFHGVALVVAKLLNRVRPDMTVFGEKDYQQLAVIRRMVRDLDMPVDIVGAPIARDAHGLALSSRNRYFDADGITVARALNHAMFGAKDALESGGDIAAILENARQELTDRGFDSVDYVSLADAETLQPHPSGPLPPRPLRLLIAAHCRGVRLIDNCAVQPPALPGTPS
ncbi:pantoate--beta-alanine ligase [uncultured Algimonas sp.]|uniref:pantoate--beta-alanine ligase n=1 Tax=uncultured Algimonas sp. TaxID=1547920 RepID=UPI00261FA610|nr:pantoate--beta-alanine ligase [uncultured Algimonas sp.]